MIAKTGIVAAWMMLIALTTATSESRPAGDTYALIVSGIGKDPEDRLVRDQIVRDFRGYLLDKAGVKPDRLAVLALGADAAGTSTADRIAETIRAYATAMSRADRLILYYTGQANAVVGSLRFNLPGPDITQKDLAKWLAPVRAGTQLVVLDCPYAAVGAKAFAHRGRVVVLASTEKQAYATRFGLHFVPALARPESDTNHDGAVSVLEAFTAAAREIEQWYQQKQLLPTETASMDDNGDGKPSERPWRYDQDGGDGGSAAKLILDGV